MKVDAIIRQQGSYFRKSILTVQLFYFCVFYGFLSILHPLAEQCALGVKLVPALFLLNWLPGRFLPGLVYLCLLPPFFAFFVPHSRALRIAVAISIFLIFGLLLCVGDRRSSGVAVLWIAVVFSFLPNWKRKLSFTSRQRVVFSVWLSTLVFLMTYVMSGLWKALYSLVLQPLQGYAGGFSPDAFARIVAGLALRSGQLTEPGNFLIHHPWVGAPGFLYAILMEITAFLPLLYPSLFRFVAVELLAFHIVSYYFLGISFSSHILLILPLLYFSPFAGTEIFPFKILLARLKPRRKSG